MQLFIAFFGIVWLINANDNDADNEGNACVCVVIDVAVDGNAEDGARQTTSA